MPLVNVSHICNICTQSICKPTCALLQGYEDVFDLRMLPADRVAYQRLFQPCVDGSLDCSDVVFIMRNLGQVGLACCVGEVGCVARLHPSTTHTHTHTQSCSSGCAVAPKVVLDLQECVHGCGTCVLLCHERRYALKLNTAVLVPVLISVTVPRSLVHLPQK